MSNSILRDKSKEFAKEIVFCAEISKVYTRRLFLQINYFAVALL